MIKTFAQFLEESIEPSNLKDQYSNDYRQLYNFIKDKIETGESDYVVKVPAIKAEDMIDNADYDVDEGSIDDLVNEAARILSESSVALLVNFLDGNEWYIVEADSNILNDEEFREIFSDIEETGIKNLFFAYD